MFHKPTYSQNFIYMTFLDKIEDILFEHELNLAIWTTQILYNHNLQSCKASLVSVLIVNSRLNK